MPTPVADSAAGLVQPSYDPRRVAICLTDKEREFIRRCIAVPGLIYTGEVPARWPTEAVAIKKLLDIADEMAAAQKDDQG